jgi:hypothetical protein
MEKKELAFQSYQRNQGLQDAIDKLLIHLKLSGKGINDHLSAQEIANARRLIVAFLLKLNDLVGQSGQQTAPLTGIDGRYRSLVRKYLEAKGKRQLYKSILFRSSPQQVLDQLQKEDAADNQELIASLTEFRTLLEDHGFGDVRELIGEL